METKKKKNWLTRALAVILALSLVIGGGTFAYLQSQSEEVTNTFNTNTVDVELEENTGEEYEIVPGTSQEKDPTVTATYTKDAYVFVEVTDATEDLVTWYIANGWNELADATDEDAGFYVYYMLLETSYDALTWTEVTDSSSDYYGCYTYKDSNGVVYYYNDSTGEYVAIIPVLEGNTVYYSADITNDMMEAAGDDLTLDFQAYIIQAYLGDDGLADPFVAYNVLNGASYVSANATYLSAVSSSSLNTSLATVAATAGEYVIVLDENETYTEITGIKTTSGTTLAVDFNGSEVSVSTPVGSTGTVANGMQLLQGSTVILSDGTYSAGDSDVHLLVQNYSDLTLSDMTLDGRTLTGTTTDSSVGWVLSCNNGNVLITGDTNIYAKDGAVALDVMYWVGYYPDGVTVTIDENMTGVVDGKIAVYKWENSTENYDDPDKATLIIRGGTFMNTGLTYAQFSKFVDEGYKAILVSGSADDTTGVYTVVPESTNTITVASNETLSTALTTAANTENPVILLGTGTYTLTDAGTIPEGTTISGVSADETTLTVTGSTYTISSDDVTLADLTVQAESISAGTHVLTVTGSDVTMDNVVVTGGSSSTGSASIYVTSLADADSTFTITNSTVSGCGRAIQYSGTMNGTLIIDNCTFDAVYPFHFGNMNGTVTVMNSTLKGWTSYGSGTGSVTFTNCVFTTGSRGYNYVAPYVTTTFDTCTFDSDFVLVWRGGTYGGSGTLTFTDSTFGGSAINTISLLEQMLEDVANEYSQDTKTWEDFTFVINGKSIDGSSVQGTIVS